MPSQNSCSSASCERQWSQVSDGGFEERDSNVFGGPPEMTILRRNSSLVSTRKRSCSVTNGSDEVGGQNSNSVAKRKRSYSVNSGEEIGLDVVDGAAGGRRGSGSVTNGSVQEIRHDVVDGAPAEKTDVSNDEDQVVASVAFPLQIIPRPWYNDTVQLKFDQSHTNGGCLRIAEDSGKGHLTVDAKGFLFKENTLFVFHHPLGWSPNMDGRMTDGSEFFLKAVHEDSPYCLAQLEDGTIGFKKYHPNSTIPIPPEARLVLEQYGDSGDPSSYRYRFKFKHGHQSSEENVSYYIGAYENGETQVFAEERAQNLPEIPTFFQMSVKYKK